MKLYTEQQVRDTIRKSYEPKNKEGNALDYWYSTDEVIAFFKPIELPSADEILYESQGVFVNRIDMYEEGFIDGAEWVVNKIKGGEQ